MATSTPDYEPSVYAGELPEDPGHILAKGTETAIARINGVNNPELLHAYLEVEIDREARQEVIGAINRRKQELQDCPRCDLPVQDRFITDEPFQIKQQNAFYYSVCMVPTDDGVIAVYHDEPEETGQDTSEGAETPPEPEPEPETEERDDPQSETAKRILDKLRASNEALSLAGLQGWAGTELDLSPDETELAVDTLVNGDYVTKADKGKYEA